MCPIYTIFHCSYSHCLDSFYSRQRKRLFQAWHSPARVCITFGKRSFSHRPQFLRENIYLLWHKILHLLKWGFVLLWDPLCGTWGESLLWSLENFFPLLLFWPWCLQGHFLQFFNITIHSIVTFLKYFCSEVTWAWLRGLAMFCVGSVETSWNCLESSVSSTSEPLASSHRGQFCRPSTAKAWTPTSNIFHLFSCETELSLNYTFFIHFLETDLYPKKTFYTWKSK